ncbi:MAG: xanthine dehydrogenase [Syntrophomonadaceae bacterium]|nr:xanthine dehydrogenase [Syntrophomonadaceae bacterium]
MIPFDFEYYRPSSTSEAVQIFMELDAAGKNPRYYGGGTELISMARMNSLSFGAVIDIKAIPECNVLEIDNGHLMLGTTLTLTRLHESNLFPLLAQAGSRVADHTIQSKITLGGNLCGSIIYKEALLPLLLTDTEALIAGPSGMKTRQVNAIFNQSVQLEPAEFIVQLHMAEKYLALPYIHVKKTKQDKINYPLVTICALKNGQEIRVAFSGVSDFPFRCSNMEAALNERSRPIDSRVARALEVMPVRVLNNLEGSADFRRFILTNLLTSVVGSLEADAI